MNLSRAVKTIRVSDSAAAAQTAVTSDAVDMRGFQACQFVVALGDITATGTVSAKVQQSSDDGATDAYSDLTGATAAATDADSDGLLVIDVSHPEKRYLKCVLTRATANSVVDGIIAQQYLPQREPITDDASVVASTFVHAPAE